MDRSPLAESVVCARLFWLWLAGRTAAWLTAVICLQPNAPLDLVELLAWGNQFSWGYPKHPPLPAWMAASFAGFSPGDAWGVYLGGYLLAATCLWSAWRVGREFLPPREALVAVICLDGLIYLTGEAAEFSNNLALSPAWALTVWFFVRATRTGRLGWWLALGVSAGLGLLCKYPLVLLLAALAGYLVCHREGRRQLRKPGPYLAGLVALALFAPHVVWLVRNDFVAVYHAAERAARVGWAGHVTHPALFLLGQVLKLAPVLVVLAPLLGRRGAGKPVAEDRALLHWAVLGPVVLLLAYSLLTGSQLRDRWGRPLWTMAGVWLLAVAGSGARARLRWSGLAWGAVAAGLLTFWALRIVAGPYVDRRETRAHYPGRLLAEEVSRRWHARCDVPFAVVAGEPWRAGNVCCYAPHRPIIYTCGETGFLEFDPETSPWTSDADLAARGGVVLWGANQLGDGLPDVVRVRFPSAEAQPPIVLPYQTGAAVRPDRVGVAFVWPAGRQVRIASQR
jgi:4-amino-4-deoxy-L-arabinose transferase-like glycosyltransferase